MASTATASLKFEKQGDGENINTWGTKANNNFDLIDEAIAGFESVAIGSTAVTLTSTNYVSDQARNAILKFTGTLTGDTTVTIPSASKWYIIWNTCTMSTYTLTVKTSGGTGVSIVGSAKVAIFCDGTDTYAFAIQALVTDVVGNDKTISQTNFNDISLTAYNAGNLTGAVTLDYLNGHLQYGTVTGNITSLTVNNWPSTGRKGQIELWATQDATGNRTLTLGASYKKIGGTIVLSTAANALDKLAFTTYDAGTSTTVEIGNGYS